MANQRLKDAMSDKLLDESLYACYEKNDVDEEGNATSKVYSTYQRNEVAQRWKREDGSIYITVRHKTKSEAETARKREAETLQKAIDEGQAIRDRIGKVKWKKH